MGRIWERHGQLAHLRKRTACPSGREIQLSTKSGDVPSSNSRGGCPALPSSGLYPVSSTGQVFPRIVLGPASFGLDTWNLGVRTSLPHPSIYLNLGYNKVSCTGPSVGSVPVGPFSSSVCELDARARTAGDKETGL